MSAPRFARFSLLVALILALPGVSVADRGPGLSLADLARRAGVAFVGTVERVEPGDVGGLPVTRVTFRVAEGLKGVAGDQVVLTLLGGERPGGRMGYRVAGLPVFAAGEEWVLLAYPPSEMGLSAPVGLYRGAFRVLEAGGRRTVLRAGPVAPGAPAVEGYAAFMERLRAAVALSAAPARPADAGSPAFIPTQAAPVAAAAGSLPAAPAGESAGTDAADLAAAAAATGRERRP